MIVLTKYLNQSNYIYATPYEKAEGIDYPYYVFNFQNRLTGEIVQLGLENISATLRFQVFQINIYPFNNSINFEDNNDGFYTYKIYGSNDGTTIESDVLENGFMLLKKNEKFCSTCANYNPNMVLSCRLFVDKVESTWVCKAYEQLK